MADVSITHASEDSRIADSIRDACARVGLDVLPEPLHAFETLVADPFAARCVIFLWSHAAARADIMQKNVQHAIRAWSDGRLVLATIDEAALPVGLRDLQGIPVNKGPAGVDAAQLLTAVQSILHPALFQATIDRSAPVPGAIPSATPPHRSHGFMPLVGVLALLVTAGMTLSWVAGDLDSPRQRGGMGMGKVAGPPDLPRTEPKFSPQRPKETAELPLPPPGAPMPMPAPAPAPPQQPAPDAAPPADGQPTRPTASGAPPSSASEPFGGIPVFLVMLILGVAIGAGSVWVWSMWLKRSRLRTPSVEAPQPMAQPPGGADSSHQVFVSYSRQDGRAVEDLVKEIEQAGYAVWMDRHSTGSQRYAAPIVRAIKSSRIVALMCSHNAFSSDHVIREVYVAGDYKKPFIAFQLDRSEFPDDVLYFVSGFPRVQTEALDIQQLRSELARLSPPSR